MMGRLVRRGGAATNAATGTTATGTKGAKQHPVSPRSTSARPGPRPGPAKRTQAGAKSPAAGGQPARAHQGRSLQYAPQLDGQADPGEIVWTWVPYEEDPSQGKDRPVLVVGRDGAIVLGLLLSSQGDRDGQPHWFALGRGDWDKQRRPSWVRLDRVLEIAEDGIRREGTVLDKRRFDLIAAQLRADYGWR